MTHRSESSDGDSSSDHMESSRSMKRLPAGKAVGLAIFAATAALMPMPRSSAFVVSNINTQPISSPRPMAASSSSNDDISKQLAKAKALLEKSKAKLESSKALDDEEEGSSSAAMPFFASVDKAQSGDQKNEKIIKSRNEQDGTVVADGDMMAKISEEEQWEVRSLYEVFENEAKDTSSTAKLAERDVAASMYNLRKSLQDSDFQRIFDSRNRWIGEQ